MMVITQTVSRKGGIKYRVTKITTENKGHDIEITGLVLRDFVGPVSHQVCDPRFAKTYSNAGTLGSSIATNQSKLSTAKKCKMLPPRTNKCQMLW